MNTITAAAVLQVCWAGVLGLPVDCGPSHCPSISQDKLLDRVIQHAELIYTASEETCSMFEDMFVPFPMRLQRNQAGNTCITKDFPIPTSKSELQQISDTWLLHSVLMLIQSWINPLGYLQTTLELYDDVPEVLLNKAKWVSEKLISLEQGVVVLIRKMLDGGILNSSYDDYSIAQMEVQPEVLESILRDYNLLCCFKKDAHKMETILKLLKCRQIDKYNCALY